MPVGYLSIAPGPYAGTNLGWLPTRPGLHGAGRLGGLGFAYGLIAETSS